MMFSLINRYVVRRLSVATLYALLALLALFVFFDVIDQIGDVGEGQYTAAKMLQYIAMQLPGRAYELMPLAVLVGGLIAMSQLAANSELTVMKTSGISTARLMAMLAQFGLLFAAFTLVLGEWVAPEMGRRAEQFKVNAQQNTISASGNSGIWMKQDKDIINVAEMLPDGTLRDITIYRHDERFQLIQTVHARAALVQADTPGQWQLQDVRTTRLLDERTESAAFAEHNWPAAVSQDLLSVLLVTPEQMSVRDLGQYIRHLSDNHQQTTRYELAWWRKLGYPLAALIMAWVALAFTPQNTRHGNMGLRLFFGICLGLAFHFSGRLFGFSSQLYGIPPVIAALLPTVLFALLALWLIRRQEKR
ncbi:lipopolysaccharide export system permease protein [Neisseria sp. HSC-16F19]|nr:lipopolysaccharide export system permease protein [Neisseria sp. HSC-16F19]